jgi:hypothetical protein
MVESPLMTKEAMDLVSQVRLPPLSQRATRSPF